jgi:hypothetical protein
MTDLTQPDAIKLAIEAIEGLLVYAREARPSITLSRDLAVRKYLAAIDDAEFAIAALRAVDGAIDRFAEGMAAITRGPA